VPFFCAPETALATRVTEVASSSRGPVRDVSRHADREHGAKLLVMGIPAGRMKSSMQFNAKVPGPVDPHRRRGNDVPLLRIISTGESTGYETPHLRLHDGDAIRFQRPMRRGGLAHRCSRPRAYTPWRHDVGSGRSVVRGRNARAAEAEPS